MKYGLSNQRLETGGRKTLRRVIWGVTAVGLAGLVPVAHANEIAEGCKAFAEENGTDATGCDCLGAAADEDEALFEALLTIETEADMAALSPAHRAVIAACFPDDETDDETDGEADDETGDKTGGDGSEG